MGSSPGRNWVSAPRPQFWTRVTRSPCVSTHNFYLATLLYGEIHIQSLDRK